MMRVLLVRHAEAIKNIEDRHGGCGSCLTEFGRFQCMKVCRRLVDNFDGLTPPLVVTHNRPQVIESAQEIARAFDVTLTVDDRLRGISLGALAGLSREEALEHLPDAAAHLEEWRVGYRTIDALDIPGAEDVDVFCQRVQTALSGLFGAAERQLVIAVLTRSTLIMIANLVRMGQRFNYEQYRPYDFAPAGVTLIEGTAEEPIVCYQDDVSHLSNDRF